MKKLETYGLWLIISMGLVLATHRTWGQAGSTKVTVKVVAFYQGQDGGGLVEGDNEYRWNFKYNGSTTATCLKKKAKDPDWWYNHHTVVSNKQHSRIPGSNQANPALYITMESWEEDEGSDCTYNSGDDIHYGPNSTVATYDLYRQQPPGNLEAADKRQAYTYNTNNRVTYEFFYTPPTPDAPSISGNPSIICVSDAITLSTNSYVHSSFHDQVRLYWEYYIEGDLKTVIKPNPDYCGEFCEGFSLPCCSEPPYITTQEENWRTLASTTANVSGGDKTVQLSNLNELNNLSERKKVHFRVRSWSNNVYGEYSARSSVDVDPVGPGFTASAIQASCSAVGTGEINISVTGNGTGKYRYLIKNSAWSSDLTGTFSTSSHTITGLEPGTYTIRLSNYRNNAAFLSACDITRTVTVGTVSSIRWNSTNTKAVNPTCPGETGTIHVEIDGGNSTYEVDFSITGSHRFARSDTRYDKGSFTGLPAGTYTVTAFDACNNTTLTKAFTISEPAKVVASVTTTHPTCDNPDNGTVKVTVSQGPGRYDYELWKGTNKVASKNGTTNASHTFNNLSSASGYMVRVYDAMRRTCDPYEEKDINLSFAPLTIELISKNDINCASETGSVNLKANGGSGSYTFTLTHKTENYQLTNSTGSFTVDWGGDYTATVKNSTSCNDSRTIATIRIDEPAPLSATVYQQNITCSGIYTGKLSATVTGGITPYSYQWQERETAGGTWYNYAGLGAKTAEITELYDARYRLIVTDKNGCKITTEEYVLLDPEELVIDTVTVQHVGCYGANDGRILPVVRGGWGDYSYQYQKEGEAGYTSFTSQTLFAPGTYRIEVADREGCTVSYDEPLTITEPAEMLTLAYVVSDHGGYQVSCFDGNDGWIEASASGGNDAPFGTRYLFALDDSAFTTEPLFTGLAPGTYLLKVQDERGCTVTQSVTLSSPESLTLITNDKNYIRCFGDSTGYIRVQAEGGVPPYQYRIDTNAWQDSPVFEQLPADNYTLTVVDGQGCETVLVESISTNDPLAITFHKTDVRCYGENNGEVTVAVNGGKAPYNLAWQEVSSTEARIDALAPGWYTLSVTDADACRLTDSILIGEPEAVLLTTPVATPVRCFGEDNGMIALPTGGGTPPYRYSLDGGATFQSDSLFTGLASGTYTTLTVDSRGCEFIAEATIVQPEPLGLSLDGKNDILCHGEATGAITVVATGGTEPYRYSLDGEVWQETSVFPNLTAGDYQVRLQDARGCKVSLEVNLIEPEAPLQLSYQVTSVQCKGSATGAIETTVTGGTAPYTYQWEGLSVTTASVNGLLHGNYVLTITDHHGCQRTDTLMVTEPVMALQGRVRVQQNVSCFGVSDGYVQIEAQGGYPPYQYSWQGNEFSDMLAYDQLSEGTYLMYIQDSVNCQVTVEVYVSQPAPLEASPDVVQHVSCFGGSDARFSAQVKGGTPPYRYSLDSGANWQPEALFAEYPTGRYTILIEDALNCRTSTQLEIAEPPVLTATIENVVEAACTQANGEARAVVQGGSPPYRYAWMNQQGETVSGEVHPINLRASVYDLYVTDAKGCQVHLTQIINDLDGPTSRITSWQDAHCYTSADGRATVTVEGGSGDYRYLWSDSLAQTGPTAKNLSRGEHFVTVTDERGCVSISSVTIGSPDAILLDTLQWQPPGCYEACDGQLEIAVQGGIAPYIYRWEGRPETTPSLSNLCRGDYTLTVTDATGCSITQVFAMTPPDSLQLTVTTTRAPTCFQGCDGQAAVAVQGGTAPYQYQWDDGARQTTPQAENLCPGAYSVTVTDAQGCQIQQSIVIEETPRIPLHLPDTVTLCLNQQVVLDATIPHGQYQWTRNGTPYGTDASITVNQAGDYQVEVINERGCRELALTQVLSYDTLFEVNFLQTTELYVGDTLALTEVCFPQPDSVYWNYTGEAQTLVYSSWEPQITFEEAGTYQVTLIGYYSVCTDSITKTVVFFPPQENIPSNSRVAWGPQGIKMLTIYPNPTDGRFRVEVMLYSTTSLYVFLSDAQGEEIVRTQQRDSDTYSFDFDISHYASGQYVLRLMTQHDKKVARIILR